MIASLMYFQTIYPFNLLIFICVLQLLRIEFLNFMIFEMSLLSN